MYKATRRPAVHHVGLKVGRKELVQNIHSTGKVSGGI